MKRGEARLAALGSTKATPGVIKALHSSFREKRCKEWEGVGGGVGGGGYLLVLEGFEDVVISVFILYYYYYYYYSDL